MSSRKDELARLIQKISELESLIERAEVYFQEHKHLWTLEVGSYFYDAIQRKREQLLYVSHQVDRLGMLIAMERDDEAPDI